MGVLKFRLSGPDVAERLPALRRAYFTGQDRSPTRLIVEVAGETLICRKESPESGRLHVPWPVEGFGTPVVGTSTLAERPEPYELVVELARGKLNDVRNQAADWRHAGLRPPRGLDETLRDASRAFSRAVTAGDPPAAAGRAQEALVATHEAGQTLVEAYTDQVLRRRQGHSQRLPTLLGCSLAGEPKAEPWTGPLVDCINSARIACSWGRFAPVEGRLRFETVDAQLSWCRKRRLTPTAGPLIEFRPGALPDWLWLWEGDFDEIHDLVVDLVRQVLTRYRGKVAVWHLIHRVGSGEVLGLSEEEQVRLAARVVQVARQADPGALLVVDLDRPWAEWMGSGRSQLGPLHLADSLARAELGLGGIGLEIAPGFEGPGSLMRDLFEFSRLLDLYSLINLPLFIQFAFPSGAGPDPKCDPSAMVDLSQWPGSPDESTQRDWAARWIALAVAKPFVRAVDWRQLSDATPHFFAHAGLFRPDGTAKPLADWLKTFRHTHLG